MTNHTPDAAVEARIDARIHEQLDYWIAQLARLCAQPSISAQRLGIEAVSYTHLTLPTSDLV